MTADLTGPMDHALRLARRGLGQVWPNPAVGCVIVKDGVVVGRGSTQPGGRPHAEAVALAQAGAAARGATAFVTLEPCAHHGRTPPCAEALIAAGVTRVVTALTDPDPRVAGGGHVMLQAAGVEVVEGIRREEAAEVNRGFLLRVTAGRPMVTLKLALSLDGRIGTAAGESRWITGAAARHRVHLLRHTHDAVLVGGGTARADVPRLDVRGFGAVRQPLRIVLARSAVPALPGGAPVWHLHGPDDATMPSAEGIAVPLDSDGLDLRAALGALGERGLTRVLCEGGGQLAASFLAAGLVDELVVMQAGLALGAEGRPGVGPLALARLADARRFRLIRSHAAGPDLVSVWRPG